MNDDKVRVAFPKSDVSILKRGMMMFESILMGHLYHIPTAETLLKEMKEIVLRGKIIPDKDKEIARLRQIAFGDTDCEDCCNHVHEPLLGCGLGEEKWLECTSSEHHRIYWNDKIKK